MHVNVDCVFFYLRAIKCVQTITAYVKCCSYWYHNGI